MRVDFGVKPCVYPMPVFIIASYDEKGVPNAMNAAWGGISEENEISLCISAGHKTTKNILASRAFTVSMATADTVAQCRLVGEIVNVCADESILTDGKIDPLKLRPITYDPSGHGYYVLGEKVGSAFSDRRKV